MGFNMDKRLVVRNRIDKPLYDYLGKLSDDTLELLNAIYDNEEEQGGYRAMGEGTTEGEGFRNRVYASQPKGHEHFHTIF